MNTEDIFCYLEKWIKNLSLYSPNIWLSDALANDIWWNNPPDCVFPPSIWHWIVLGQFGCVTNFTACPSFWKFSLSFRIVGSYELSNCWYLLLYVVGSVRVLPMQCEYLLLPSNYETERHILPWLPKKLYFFMI